jgi:hypothetical protein
MTWARHVAYMGERRGINRASMEKPEGKGTLGRARNRWSDNINMDIQEVGWGGIDKIDLAQVRNRWRESVMNFRVLRHEENVLTS